MSNTRLYDETRAVPQSALREIRAGRLKGKSDINPMWRIRTLTEQFGPCGIGWRYTIDKQWVEQGADGEQAAFVNISLYIKVEGEWSAAIPGTGGSAFVAKEKSGLYTNYECYKMALTDAISVACKALGFGADVYWGSGETKHSESRREDSKPHITPAQEAYDQLIQWIDKASQERGKIPDQEAFKNWFLNDENTALVDKKSCLSAEELSAVNRHFEQTMRIVPPKKEHDKPNQDIF